MVEASTAWSEQWVAMRGGWKVDGDWIEKSLPDQMKNLALFKQQGTIESFKSTLALYFIIVIGFSIRNLDQKLMGADSKGPIHQT